MHLFDKIYIICYNKKIWTGDIAKKIWGDNFKSKMSTLSKSDGPLKQLVNKGYLKEKLRPEEETTNKRYYLSTPNYLLNYIKNEIKINEIDSKRLEEILDSPEFRQYVNYHPKLFKELQSITNIISTIATQITFAKDMYKAFPIKPKFDFKKIIKEIQNKTIDDNNIFNKKYDKIFEKSIESTTFVLMELLKFKQSTLNKFMQLNPNYLINYYSLLGTFIFGLETELNI
jgi:hypothetical protein